MRVGSGALATLLDDLVRDPPGAPLIVVSDRRVAPLHARPLVRALERAGLSTHLVAIPPGERSKSRQAKARLEDELFALGADRGTALVAVGGGVVGDLAGFVAATWHRGVPVVQVPTTLLAMVDAALGGKTAVNLPGGKNLVGSFHQPWGVYADIGTLATLAERQYVAGFAELVKTAAVADARLFGWIERSVDALRRRDPVALEHAVGRCLRLKGAVVRADERESGPRAALNFGHTVAHALEAASAFRWSHGAAVAVGLCVEARLAERLVGFPHDEVARLRALIGALGLPLALPRSIPPETILAAARRDKKTRAGRLRCALPRRIGTMPPGADVTVEVPRAELARALAACTN